MATCCLVATLLSVMWHLVPPEYGNGGRGHVYSLWLVVVLVVGLIAHCHCCLGCGTPGWTIGMPRQLFGGDAVAVLPCYRSSHISLVSGVLCHGGEQGWWWWWLNKECDV